MSRIPHSLRGRRLAASLVPLAIALSAAAQSAPVTRAPTSQVPAPAPIPPPSPMAHAQPPIQRQKLPDLAFANVSVNGTNHMIGTRSSALVVDHVFPAPSPGAKPAPSPCNRSFTFPVVLVIKNIGTADFVPLSSAQAVGLDILPFNAAKDLIKLAPGASQSMSFSVTLPPGNYNLNAFIDTHGQVAESNVNNNKLDWPLKVTCELRSNAAVAPAPIKNP